MSARTPSPGTPPEPAEVAIADSHWRRTGLLQRLVKLPRRVHAPGAADRPSAETTASRRRAKQHAR